MGNNPDHNEILNAKNTVRESSQSPEVVHKSMAERSQEIQPHENDILMGRGGKNNQHVGNEKLRGLARLQSENYRAASKKGKSCISRDLVKQVRNLNPPGRFLKKNNGTGAWEDVGDDVAREKASQVLRDAVSFSIQPEMEERCESKAYHPIEELSDDVRRSVYHPIEELSDDARRSASAPPILRETSRRRHWEEIYYRTPPHHHDPPPRRMPSAFYPPRSMSSHSDPSAKRPRYYRSTREGQASHSTYNSSPIRYPFHQGDYTRSLPTSPLSNSRVVPEEHVSPPNLTTSGTIHTALDENDLISGELLHSDGEHDDDDDSELSEDLHRTF